MRSARLLAVVSLVVALVAVLLLGLALAAGWFGDLVALALPLVTWVSVAGTLAALLIAPDWVIVPLSLDAGENRLVIRYAACLESAADPRKLAVIFLSLRIVSA